MPVLRVNRLPARRSVSALSAAASPQIFPVGAIQIGSIGPAFGNVCVQPNKRIDLRRVLSHSDVFGRGVTCLRHGGGSGRMIR
jgi:hypothetical protein